MATSIDAFTQDEITQIQESMTAVIFGAIASEPPGPLGFVKELVGGAKGMATGLESAHSDLLNQLLKSKSDDSASTTSDPDESMFESEDSREATMSKAIAAAVSARDLLRSRAEPADVDGFANALIETAQRAVEATKKGGFLGIGGEKVSPNEAAYVSRLRAALA